MDIHAHINVCVTNMPGGLFCFKIKERTQTHNKLVVFSSIINSNVSRKECPSDLVFPSTSRVHLSWPWYKMDRRKSIVSHLINTKILIDVEFNFTSIGIFVFIDWATIGLPAVKIRSSILVRPLRNFRIVGVDWSKSGKFWFYIHSFLLLN